jgi:hypothetical protein
MSRALDEAIDRLAEACAMFAAAVSEPATERRVPPGRPDTVVEPHSEAWATVEPALGGSELRLPPPPLAAEPRHTTAPTGGVIWHMARFLAQFRLQRSACFQSAAEQNTVTSGRLEIRRQTKA